MAKIMSLLENGIGEEIGVQIGDELIGINNMPLEDILQYQYFDKQKQLTLNVKTSDGKYVFYKIQKDKSEMLGLEFDSSLDIKAKLSENKCLFDLVSQLPNKFRSNKDSTFDDWRLSALVGDYVSLTNLNKKDIARILKERLSPLYISLHSLNNKLRNQLLGNCNTKNIYKLLKKLVSRKITIFAQITLCPKYNDADNLKNTLKKASKLYPYLNCVAINPVHLTIFKNKDCNIEPVTYEDANKCLDIINNFNDAFSKKHDVNFAFASDEIYYKAKRVVPNVNYYRNFNQLNISVGVISKLRHEINLGLKKIKNANNIESKANIVAVDGMAEFLNEVADRVNSRFKHVKVKVYKIFNNTIGRDVAANNVICGTDIINQLKNKNIIGKIIIFRNMLREGEDVFLDGVSLEELKRELKTEVQVINQEGYELLQAVLAQGENK